MLSKSKSEKEVSKSGGGEAGAEEEAATVAATPEDLSPPYIIMEHFPLAVFTNAVLTGLNELRHCALLGLSKPLAG